MGNLLRRVLVAAIAIPILVWLFMRGGWPLGTFVLLLTLLGVYEAADLVTGRFSFGWIVAALMALAGVALIDFGLSEYWPAWIALAVILPGVVALFDRNKDRAARDAVAHTTAILWLGFGFGAILALGPDQAGDHGIWLLFLFANLWISDTAAYFVGSTLGKRPLAPHISPKKTIAGLVGQLAGSVAVGAVFVWGGWIPGRSPLWLIACAFVVGVAAVVGDLYESIWKRAAGAKDSSAIIPGHGGVLDRFDSALFAAPVLYLYLQLIP